MSETMIRPAELEQAGQMLGGRKVLKHLPATELEAHDLVRRGLPAEALGHLVDALVILKRPEQLEAALGVSIRTFQRRKTDSRPLDPDQSGRAWQFARILARATEVFGSQEAAERWLEMPALALDRRRPIDLLSTHEGLTLVETLLTRLDYGVYT
jgi:putative toxin-antitoxin system antitoxin component (TIGR02293 family)